MMQTQWTPYQKSLHERAKYFSHTRERVDRGFIKTLQRIEREGRLGYSDLFSYLCKGLGMSKRNAYEFKAVALRAMAVPALDRALRDGHISVNRASRTLPVLNAENGDYLIEFAMKHTEQELDFEVARLNPHPRQRTVARAASEDHYRVNTDLSRETWDKLCRARTLLGNVEVDATLDRVLDDFLNRHDPVRKADRAQAKKAKATPVASSAPRSAPADVAPPKRDPPNADQTHTANARDRGQCTWITADGKRCSSPAWVELHHIIPVSEGGSNDPTNLTTLCRFHHALVHRQGFSGRPESS